MLFLLLSLFIVYFSLFFLESIFIFSAVLVLSFHWINYHSIFSIYSRAACKRRSSRYTVCYVDGLFVSPRWNTRRHHQVRPPWRFPGAMLWDRVTRVVHVLVRAARGHWKWVRFQTSFLSFLLDYFRLVPNRETGTSLVMVITTLYSLRSVLEERLLQSQ